MDFSAARSFFFGVQPRTGKRFIVQSIEGGGWGGRPFEGGESGSVTICQGDVRNGTIESIELKSPVLIEERSLRRDSGGAVKLRGGLGIDLRVRNLAEGRWNLRTENKTILDARGDPPRASELDVRAKFHRLADPLLGLPAARHFAQACLAAMEEESALEILCSKIIS